MRLNEISHIIVFNTNYNAKDIHPMQVETVSFKGESFIGTSSSRTSSSQVRTNNNVRFLQFLQGGSRNPATYST